MIGSMTYAQAETCADQLKAAASAMDDLFSQLKNEMNSLESVLKSKGADELYATYKSLEAKLDGFPSKVRSFEGFLRTAVAQYQADDASLSSQV